MRALLLWLSLLSVGLAATAPIGTLSLDYASKYLFRGEELAASSLQPSFNLQYGSAYLNVWANRPTRSQSSEVDLTLGSTAKALDLGLTAYTYPGSAQTTWEPYLGLVQDLGDILKGSVYAFHDLTLHNTTFEGKLSAKIWTAKKLESTVEGVLGTTHGRELPAYTYWSSSLILRWSITEGVVIPASVQYAATRGSSALWGAKIGVALNF